MESSQQMINIFPDELYHRGQWIIIGRCIEVECPPQEMPWAVRNKELAGRSCPCALDVVNQAEHPFVRKVNQRVVNRLSLRYMFYDKRPGILQVFNQVTWDTFVADIYRSFEQGIFNIYPVWRAGRSLVRHDLCICRVLESIGVGCIKSTVLFLREIYAKITPRLWRIATVTGKSG